VEPSILFSIILPIWHAGDDLREALHSLRHIDFPPERFEVIVVGVHGDSLSKTTVQKIATEAAFPIRFVEGPKRHRAAQLNIACRSAQGSILVFSDDDCVFRSDWLTSLEQVFDRETELGIVGGADELETDGSAFSLALDYVLQSFIGTGGIRRPTSLNVGKYYPRLWNMAVPREIAWNVALGRVGEPAQIFNEALIPHVHEDVELSKRIAHSGKRIVFAPEVRVGHRRDTTFWRFLWRGVEKAQTSRMLGTHRVAHGVLALGVISLGILSVGSIFSVFLKNMLMGIGGVYGMLLFLAGIDGARRTRNFKTFLLIPGLFLSVHFARGIGYLLPLFKKQTRTGI
jgi:GT2 family glycosyltransferase